MRVEDELARRGYPFWTKPRHNDRGQPCPRCGGTDRFSINLRKQLFNCRGCGTGGDVIKLVQFLDGSDFQMAVETLAGPAPKGTIEPPNPAAVDTRKFKDGEAAERRRKIDTARGIWNRRRSINGTLAEHYLRFRGLDIDANHLDYMGFDPEAAWREIPNDPASPLLRVPCLIAVYRAIEGGEIAAVQKTRLNPNGSKWVGADRKTARRFNGCPGGAVIKIDPDENVTAGLILGEGLETVLSARALGFRPVLGGGLGGRDRDVPRARRRRMPDPSYRTQ